MSVLLVAFILLGMIMVIGGTQEGWIIGIVLVVICFAMLLM